MLFFIYKLKTSSDLKAGSKFVDKLITAVETVKGFPKNLVVYSLPVFWFGVKSRPGAEKVDYNAKAKFKDKLERLFPVMGGTKKMAKYRWFAGASNKSKGFLGLAFLASVAASVSLYETDAKNILCKDSPVPGCEYIAAIGLIGAIFAVKFFLKKEIKKELLHYIRRLKLKLSQRV